MAVGQAVTIAPTAVAAASNLDIKPAVSTAEWIIHNVYVPSGSNVTLYRGDGTNWISVDTINGSMLSYVMHVTYTQYLRVTNNGATSIYVSYDGITSA